MDRISEDEKLKYKDKEDEISGIFGLMKPKEGAIESFIKLSKVHDTYILSTAPWENPTAWSDKLNWIKCYLGEVAKKRLILSHHKNLLMGEYLIDDRKANGSDRFQGEHIYFSKDKKFPDWSSVCAYLLVEMHSSKF